jgi:ketosteroid isomerase-like protein
VARTIKTEGFPPGTPKYPAMCQARTMGRPEYYGNPAGLTEDIDVVKGIYDAFAARDLEGALAFIAPDCEIHLEGTARLVGRTEPYRGHAGMREYFDDVERAWEELTIHATDFRVIPGSVIVMGHVTGRIAGDPVRRAAVWTWRVRDGRAVYFRVADMGTPPQPAAA